MFVLSLFHTPPGSSTAQLLKSLWGEALMHTTWLKNHMSTKALVNTTPFEALTGTKPDLSELHEWGQKVSVHDPANSKLGGRAKDRRWVGFGPKSKGLRVYWPDKITVSTERSIKFNTDYILVPNADLPSSPSPSTTPSSTVLPTQPDVTAEDTPETPATEPVASAPAPQGRGARLKHPSQYIQRLQAGEGTTTGELADNGLPHGIQSASIAEIYSDEDNVCDYAMSVSIPAGTEPKNEWEARGSPDWPQWHAAMKKEISELTEKNTWTVVDAPAGTNIIGSRWMYWLKRDAQGAIARYKARLIAQGFTQAHGIDYNKTFAPVAKFASIRVVLALVALNDWEVEQVDIKNAYLNAQLTETIYMAQPPGFVEPGQAHKVCQLLKALYGLKQASRCWYQQICKVFAKFGYTHCIVECCTFFKWVDNDVIIVVIVVDDLTLASSSKTLLLQSKGELKSEFEISDMGEIHWLLGVEVKQNRDAQTVTLSQKAYIDAICSWYHLEDARPAPTPMEARVLLNQPATDELDSNWPYKEIIGSLMYAATLTRPDIAFATSALAQFMQSPTRIHWEAAKRVARYLKSTRDLELTYSTRNEMLVGYSDADHTSQPHRHSTSGYVFLIGGGAVTWSSKKQPIITLSTTEAEYIAAAHAMKEAMWLRTFVGELTTLLSTLTTIFCDNQVAIALSKDGQYHRMSTIQFKEDVGDEMMADITLSAMIDEGDDCDDF